MPAGVYVLVAHGGLLLAAAPLQRHEHVRQKSTKKVNLKTSAYPTETLRDTAEGTKKVCIKKFTSYSVLMCTVDDAPSATRGKTSGKARRQRLADASRSSVSSTALLSTARTARAERLRLTVTLISPSS